MAKSWTNLAGGLWTEPLDWVGGVPTATDDATINNAGTYTVTLASGDTDVAHSLTIGDVSATVELLGSATLTLGNATTGGLTNAGTLKLTGATSQVSGVNIVNTGTITTAAGSSLTARGTSGTNGTFTKNAGSTTIGGALNAANVSILSGTFTDNGTFTNT
ncbi:MAG: hypothetical protein ACREOE_13420, partial [Gemmatimonadales bacterium]